MTSHLSSPPRPAQIVFACDICAVATGMGARRIHARTNGHREQGARRAVVGKELDQGCLWACHTYVADDLFGVAPVTLRVPLHPALFFLGLCLRHCINKADRNRNRKSTAWFGGSHCTFGASCWLPPAIAMRVSDACHGPSPAASNRNAGSLQQHAEGSNEALGVGDARGTTTSTVEHSYSG